MIPARTARRSLIDFVAGAMTAALTRLSQAGASRIKCALDWWVGTRIVENPLRSAFCAMRVNVS